MTSLNFCKSWLDINSKVGCLVFQKNMVDSKVLLMITAKVIKVVCFQHHMMWATILHQSLSTKSHVSWKQRTPTQPAAFFAWVSFLRGFSTYAEFLFLCGFCGITNYHYIQKNVIIKSQEWYDISTHADSFMHKNNV